ncbi:hypothetical protein Patl1_06184 [Pistacia atlantica]|uniref:Uncharacterized protein n=1 Tax=Pistacia atlantica TaxID=434234 RepID=A0ACC1BQU4_9ROSI|nr:hypothetical protein Patl1_06184 [Pistacia atlantica]
MANKTQAADFAAAPVSEAPHRVLRLHGFADHQRLRFVAGVHLNSFSLSEQHPNIVEKKIEGVRNGHLVSQLMPNEVLKGATISNREYVQVRVGENGKDTIYHGVDKGHEVEGASIAMEKLGRNDVLLANGDFNPKLGSCSNENGRIYENMAAKVDKLSKDYPPFPSKAVDGVNRIEKPTSCGDEKSVKGEEKRAWTSVLVSKSC